MDSSDRTLAALREAVNISPDNVPLRQHFADSLCEAGAFAEAVEEYRKALTLTPGSVSLKISLAKAFHRLGKDSEALVILESLTNQKDPPTAALLLLARVLLTRGDIEGGRRAYRRAVEADPAAADVTLAKELGDQRVAQRQGEFGAESTEVAALDEADNEDEPANDEGIDRPRISFKDVGGMESVKDEIRMKIIHPLTHPELYAAYGKKVGGGILMYGPPGCGKTYLARATAGEIKAAFLSVGINDVLDMWLGGSEKNLHETFERARRNKPCVMFFDEVDALAASRADMRQSAGRHLINQFLSELDGVTASNDGVLILAATNAPWHLDVAFRRPGRFDQILFVPPPDAVARASILSILMEGKPADSVDYAIVAKKTDQFSGADLKAVIDLAVDAKLRKAMKQGVPSPISTKDLTDAAGKIKPTMREWFATAKNYATYANQGGVYDDVLKYMKG